MSDDPAAGTVSTGGDAADDDPPSRDHSEQHETGAAALSDLGRVRAANEDAFGLARLRVGDPDDPDDDPDDRTELVVAVVCDGVASVPGSAEASAVACTTVLATARAAVRHPDPDDPDREHTAGLDLPELARDCADTAIDAVTALADPDGHAPACTYVAALVTGPVLVVSWIGDSRAYWLVPDEPEASALLTVDDSWAAEAVAIGLLEPAAAYADPRAHAITRWVAADGPPGSARVVAHGVDRSGLLLLCSDGLWNHVPHPADLAALVSGSPDDGWASPASAHALLDAALDDGGTDNTTLVVIDVPLVTSGGS